MKNEQIFLTPRQIGGRWQFHTESVRRKIRRGEIPSIMIGRRRLVALEVIKEIERGSAVGLSRKGGARTQ